MDWCAQQDDGVVVRVRVTPNARRSEVIDDSGDRLRVRIAAPAVEGKANDELVRFIAELFGVRRGAVAISAGEHGREKTLVVSGGRCPS